MKTAGDFLPILKILHEQIRDAVVEACEKTAVEQLAGVAKEEEGDTIYAIDRVSEELLVEFFEREIANQTSVVLVAEGLEKGKIVLPDGIDENEAEWRIIVDPIDGTRGLMYQKRPAWILTGIAKNKGENTNLSDLEAAIQTEIPLVKQHLSDTLWAEKGKGVKAERFNRITKESVELNISSSSAETIAHGFATISRFFPGVGIESTEIYEEIVRGALGVVESGKAQCFEDQYISTGGQFYELMCGHDRFIADLRPVFEKSLQNKGFRLGICCHPYDLCTELIAREAGVILTDEIGGQLSAKLSVEPDVAWVGYANEAVRKQVEPLLQQSLRSRNLI
ncbi:MAG TPA: inositol monophosphatase family protein [Pyrinomonadaceae bacterium]|nr:inositol monophosphatase family protein [Pyrinomonadaceae bacterium]